MKLFIFFFFLSIHVPLFGWSVKSFVAPWLFKQDEEVITKSYDNVPKDAVLTMEAFQGDIHIKSWNQNTIKIEAVKQGKIEELKNVSIAVKNDNKFFEIKTISPIDSSIDVIYTLLVPPTLDLTINLAKGAVAIRSIEGKISVSALNGDIRIHNSMQSVSAKAPQGMIKLSVKKFPPTENLFLEAYRDITLLLPININARLHAKTLQGTITSDIFIKLDEITTQLNKQIWQRMQKNINGTIGTGGAPIVLDSTKGNISLDLIDE